jgi:hypothetical protein
MDAGWDGLPPTTGLHVDTSYAWNMQSDTFIRLRVTTIFYPVATRGVAGGLAELGETRFVRFHMCVCVLRAISY